MYIEEYATNIYRSTSECRIPVCAVATDTPDQPSSTAVHQRCDWTRTTTPATSICARQSHTGHPSAVASQAESASSILVTRSMMKPQVSGLGFMFGRWLTSGFSPARRTKIGHAEGTGSGRQSYAQRLQARQPGLTCGFAVQTGTSSRQGTSACRSLRESECRCVHSGGEPDRSPLQWLGLRCRKPVTTADRRAGPGMPCDGPKAVRHGSHAGRG